MRNSFEKLKAEEIEKEPEGPENIEFFASHHSAELDRLPLKEEQARPFFKELYKEMKENGIESARMDMRWKGWETKKDTFNMKQSERYALARELMRESGLKEPSLVLFEAPDWAKKLKKENPEDFFEEFEEYIREIRRTLESDPCDKESKVERFQIWNEVNNRIYSDLTIEELERMLDIAGRELREYNPEAKLSVSLLVEELYKTPILGKMLGEPADKFLDKLEIIKDKIDIIALDYYPGTYSLKNKKTAFKEMGLLRGVFEKLSKWGKEYELGEIGTYAKEKLRQEYKQRYFYDVFFKAFRSLLKEMHEKKMKLPSRVGLYEYLDEEYLKKTEGWSLTPEAYFGMRTEKGEKKSILKGSRHKGEISFRQEKDKKPRLKEIIEYVKRPFENL